MSEEVCVYSPLTRKKYGLTSNCRHSQNPVHMCVLSYVWLFAIPWTVTHQDSLFMGCSRHESWSGLPFPPPGDLPDPGIEPTFPALAVGFFNTELPGRVQSMMQTNIDVDCKTQNSGLRSKEEKPRDPISQSSRCNTQEGLLTVAQTGDSDLWSPGRQSTPNSKLGKLFICKKTKGQFRAPHPFGGYVGTWIKETSGLRVVDQPSHVNQMMGTHISLN